VWWFNTQRLHYELDYRTPAEVEAEYYAENTPALATAIDGKSSEQNPGRLNCPTFQQRNENFARRQTNRLAKNYPKIWQKDTAPNSNPVG
jgi:hypothetical protein